ncbi:hypothetical protein [Methylocystis parvus]|uniref:Uncharacterized protein n=1 Tax=Methylocystis parvus TaxID=134 RepID=A0A6B8M6I9_9HYPH|nr:hypothetical protein [Methylocystis parvus]QGM97955.1 hypothetical protein F7D14_11040 [Methylocystis parvus]WBK01731.1 hypothetical protein MMG94_08530 [Methylocystis parvus OBBP]
MTEKVAICLIGPKKGGKSSLLASLADCVAQASFGYSPRLRPALQPIAEAEFKAEPDQRRDLLNVEQGDYDRLKRDFSEGGVATDTLNTYEYYFRLSVNGEAPPEVVTRGPWLLEIIDSAGEIAAPPDGAEVAILNDVKSKLARQMLTSEALVIVLPLVRLDDSAWTGTLARLIDRLALAREKKLKRVVVVFSQYERLFTRLGPSAFTYACDPAVALHVLRKSLRAAQWLNRLRALEPSGVAVRYTVCSAYGFVKRFQNPNMDPHQPGERRFRRAGLEGARACSEYWRPFLTAEPILYAALGLDSAFTFSHAQLDARVEEISDASILA